MLRIPAVLLTVAAALLFAPTAEAVYTSTLSGSTATLIGDGASNSLTLGEAGGLLNHNRFGDPGFSSNFDWDTTAPGDQTLGANDTATLLVQAGGGADAVTMSTTGFATVSLDGGSGADALTGSTDAETFTGGAEADAILAGGGADVLSGDTGGDALNGGDGDDQILWRNGDGSDTVDGGAGADTADVAGGPSGDTFVVRPSGAATVVERVAPGAFTVTATAVEVAFVDGRAGNDTLTVNDGVGAAVHFEGSTGDDTFAGAGGGETFFGGSGNDTGTGGAGGDLLDGGEGNDTFLARDQAPDLIRCGDGSDSAQTDAVTVDGTSGCESVDATPPPAPATVTVPGPTVLVPGPVPVLDRSAPNARFAATTAKLAKNRRSFPVRVACPAGEACRVAFDVLLASRVTIRGVRVRALVTSVTATVAAGRTATLTVRVPASITRLFRGRSSLGLRLAGTVRDSADNSRALAGRLTLRR